MSTSTKIYIQPLNQVDQSMVDLEQQQQQQSSVALNQQQIAQSSDDNQKQSNNFVIRVKDSATNEEYKGEVHLNPQYLSKVNRWIQKSKYACLPLNNGAEMELRIEIFKFVLKKQPKSDVELLKEQLSAIRKDNKSLSGQLKTFRYYFLQIWKDKMRQVINMEKPELRQKLIESSKNLYEVMDANALILEDFGAKTYYLTFLPSKEALEQQMQQQDNMHQQMSLHQSTTTTSGNPAASMMFGGTPNPSATTSTPSGGSMFPHQHQQHPAGFEDSLNQIHGGDAAAASAASGMELDSAMSNLMAWSNEMQEDQQSSKNGELEIFLSGGIYDFKQACIDIGKMQRTGDGAVITRINMPIDETQTYQVYVPKKLM